MGPDKMRVRRAALLCCHFMRNLTFYRAGWENGQFLFQNNQFWITLNNNFLDVAVLEWCKLFADVRARHCYKKVVISPTAFLPQLVSDYDKNLIEWEQYVKSIKVYRDKFIAHLDDKPTMDIPEMDWAYFSANYLYDTLRSEGIISPNSLPRNLGEYASVCRNEAINMYKSTT